MNVLHWKNNRLIRIGKKNTICERTFINLPFCLLSPRRISGPLCSIIHLPVIFLNTPRPNCLTA